MGDYSNQGATYSAALSSFAIGPDTLGLVKFKPFGFSQDIQKGRELGNPDEICFIEGPVTYENATASVRAAEWERWAAANPAWATTEYPVSMSLRGRDVETRTINAPRARVIKATPTEADSNSTSEILYELEISGLGIRTGDRRWFQE